MICLHVKPPYWGQGLCEQNDKIDFVIRYSIETDLNIRKKLKYLRFSTNFVSKVCNKWDSRKISKFEIS